MFYTIAGLSRISLILATISFKKGGGATCMSEHSVSFIERRLAYDIDKVKNPFKKGGKKKTEKK